MEIHLKTQSVRGRSWMLAKQQTQTQNLGANVVRRALHPFPDSKTVSPFSFGARVMI